MVGHSRSRFVNLTVTQTRNLSCNLCGHILSHPVMIPCCRKLYCKLCLDEWRYRNKVNECVDGKHWLSPHVPSYKAPKIVVNMLSELEIRCNYWSHGCNEVMHLKQLSAHSDNCNHNPKRKFNLYDIETRLTESQKKRKCWGSPKVLL